MQISGLPGSIDVRLTAIRFAALETNLYELSRPDGEGAGGIIQAEGFRLLRHPSSSRDDFTGKEPGA